MVVSYSLSDYSVIFHLCSLFLVCANCLRCFFCCAFLFLTVNSFFALRVQMASYENIGLCYWERIGLRVRRPYRCRELEHRTHRKPVLTWGSLLPWDCGPPMPPADSSPQYCLCLSGFPQSLRFFLRSPYCLVVSSMLSKNIIFNSFTYFQYKSWLG